MSLLFQAKNHLQTSQFSASKRKLPSSILKGQDKLKSKEKANESRQTVPMAFQGLPYQQKATISPLTDIPLSTKSAADRTYLPQRNNVLA